MASLTPALTMDGYGCFLPDLTRFATLQCGETRHAHSNTTVRTATSNLAKRKLVPLDSRNIELHKNLSSSVAFMGRTRL